MKKRLNRDRFLTTWAVVAFLLPGPVIILPYLGFVLPFYQALLATIAIHASLSAYIAFRSQKFINGVLEVEE